MLDKNKRGPAMTTENNYIVTKHNVLINASYKLTLLEQKFILACLGKTDSRKEISLKTTLSASEFEEMGVAPSNLHRDLIVTVNRLFERSITIEDENVKDTFRWIQRKIIHKKGDARVTIYWSDEVLQYISQLKNRFTQYRLKNVKELRSSHSIRLYELLIQYKFTSKKELIIDIDKFREALGLTNEYTKFKDFRKRVLEPAVKELNTHSDLTITLDNEKTGRKITALIFKFKINDQRDLFVDEDAVPMTGPGYGITTPEVKPLK
jgi:plasmid replication initiation protein